MVTNHGSFDRKNTHYCSRENEHLYITARHQHRFGFNMWVAIFGTRIIVPSIYHETQTSERYRNSLENHLEEALDDLPIAEVQNSVGFNKMALRYIIPEKSVRFYPLAGAVA